MLLTLPKSKVTLRAGLGAVLGLIPSDLRIEKRSNSIS
jgi:hypothetical protein